MMLFHITQVHTPEQCPEGDCSRLLCDVDAAEITLLGAYTAVAEHTVFYLVEADSQEVLDAFLAQGLPHATAEIKLVRDDTADVRASGLTIDDVLLISDNDMRCHVIPSIDLDEVLPMALKGTSDGVKDRFFRNMTKRLRALTEEASRLLGPRSRRDIEAARAEIVTAIRQLLRSGCITLRHESHESLTVED